MVELARPAQYADSEPELMMIPLFLGGAFGALPHQEPLWEGDGSNLARVRYFSVVGHAVGGTVGSLVLTFQALYGGNHNRTFWPTTGGLVAAADTNVQRNEDFLYTWSTEVADNYNNLDGDFGRIWVGGLPLVFLPQGIQLSLLLSKAGGYDGDFSLEQAELQIELFQPSAGTGTTAKAGDVYLLPQTI